MMASRRAILAGFASVGVAAGGGGAAALLPQTAPSMCVLGGYECDVIRQVGRVAFPGQHLPSAEAVGLVERVDALVDEVLRPIHRTGFRYVLRTLEFGTLASRGLRFSELPVPTASEVLATWSLPDAPPRRVAGDALKAMVSMAYFSHPKVHAALGWRSECGVRGTE